MSTLAFWTEAQVFKNRKNRDTERVIDHGDVHLIWTDARFAETNRTRLDRGARRNVRASLGVLSGLPCPQDPDRFMAAIPSHIRCRDDHGTASIRNHAALQKV